MSRHYAHYLASGSQVATNLLTRVNTPHPCEIQPVYEKQVRPLRILEPEQAREVWEEAVKTAPPGKTPTYNHVRATVTALIGPAPEPNPPSASHSEFTYSGPPRRAPFTPPPFPWGDCLRAVAGL